MKGREEYKKRLLLLFPATRLHDADAILGFVAVTGRARVRHQGQALLTPKKYPPPRKTSKATVSTHQTSATPQPTR